MAGVRILLVLAAFGIGMLGTFIHTIVICTMTALVIVMTGVWSSGETGVRVAPSEN